LVGTFFSRAWAACDLDVFSLDARWVVRSSLRALVCTIQKPSSECQTPPTLCNKSGPPDFSSDSPPAGDGGYRK